MMSKVSVEQILYSNFIKYDRLKELTLEAFSNSNSNHVNIFIDMYSMLLGIYEDNVMIEDYSSITSSIINLCAHMREYYRSRHGVSTTIYIIYSEPGNSNQEVFCQGYNEVNNGKIRANKKKYDMVMSNIELLNLLCPYLYDIFFIYKPRFEPSVVIYDIICKNEVNKNLNPNIIISKSIFAYQIPAMNRNTVLFRPKKKLGEDISWMVNFSNIYYNYIYKVKHARSDNYYSYNKLNSELFSAVLALTGMGDRNIKSSANIKQAGNLLIDAIDGRLMLNTYNRDPGFLYSAITQYNTLKIAGVTFEHRFKAIDLLFQHSIYMESPVSKDYSSIVNLFDDNAVREINDKYFKNAPLDLNSL